MCELLSCGFCWSSSSTGSGGLLVVVVVVKKGKEVLFVAFFCLYEYM